MISHAEKFNVLNFNENRVSVAVSPTESITFEPSVDGKTPSVIPMTFEQIRYANNYNAFRGGFLFFEKNQEKEIYEELGINDWENILNNGEIKEILLNPTCEGLQKIIGIKDSSVFERVRAVFHKINAKGGEDVSVRVQQIIKTRYKELQNRRTTSSIIIAKEDIAQPLSNKEVESLKAENKAMQQQLEDMKALMEKLLAQQSTNVEIADNKESAAKSPGRPKKSKE